jgi:protein TonB
MILFAAADLADLRRWAVSAILVIAAHGGIAAAIGWHREAVEEIVFPFDFQVPGELAAPPEVLTELPPGPEQVMSEAAQAQVAETAEERPEEKAEHKPLEEVVEQTPVTPDPEVPVEQAQEAKPTKQAQEAQLPAPATTAPRAIPDRVAAVASAPVLTWKGLVSRLLERHKRYPAAAHSRREQGVVHLSFTIDRKGQVLASRIARGSGSALLDEEAIALVQRAQPFPTPPKEIAGEQIRLTVPIRFNLR